MFIDAASGPENGRWRSQQYKPIDRLPVARIEDDYRSARRAERMRMD
jgi:hypothetical protein